MNIENKFLINFEVFMIMYEKDFSVDKYSDITNYFEEDNRLRNNFFFIPIY